MDLKCFVPDCTTPPIFSCFCTPEGTALCHLHIPNHIQKYSNLPHSYKSILKAITPDMKVQISKFLNSEMLSLKSEIKNFNTFTSKILSAVQMISKDHYTKNKLMSNICSKILKEINENNMMAVLCKKNEDEDDQLNLEDVKYEIRKRFKQQNNNNAISFETLVNNFIEEYHEFESYLKKIMCKETYEIKSNSSCIYLFQPYTKNLMKFDTENFTKTSENINIDSNQGYLAAYCLLTDNKLFISGGLTDEHLSSSYLIDLSSKIVEKLDKNKPRSHACDTLYNNKVYIFGGYTTNLVLLNASDSYDLIRRQWNKLSYLPKAVFNTSLLNANNRCLIAGVKDFMYAYDWNSDSYSEVVNSLTISNCNSLIKDNKKIHLINYDILYLSSIYEINSWQQAPLIGTLNATTCLPVIKGRLAYFVDMQCNIYQYNLDSYRIEL